MFLNTLLEIFFRVYIWLVKRSLPIVFPYYKPYRYPEDPFQTNLIFPRNEWSLDSPIDDTIGSDRRDRVVFHACDPDDGEQLLVSFERIREGFAQVWIVLHYAGRTYTFSKPQSVDNSSGHVYSGDGIRLECDAPMRRWRLAFNGVMTTTRKHGDTNESAADPSSQKVAQTNKHNKVHVKFGIRFSVGSHPFEWPRQLDSRQLSSICMKLPSNASAVDAIHSSLANLDSFDQFGTFYTNLTVAGGPKLQKPLFGGRVKEVGTGALQGLISKALEQGPVRHLLGYANNGTMLHCIVTGKDRSKTVVGCVYSPRHFMKHIQNGSLIETANGATLSFQSAHLSYELTLRRKGDSLQFLGQGQHSVQMSEGSADINGEKFKISLFEVSAMDVKSDRWPVSSSRSSSRTEMSEHLVLTAKSTSQLSPKAPEPMYIVSTSEFAARQAELTGGKGSSLAVLTALAQLTVGQDTKFEVPNAIVLTVNAYAAFSKQTPVVNAIKQLQVEATTASGAKNGEALRNACERCEDAVRMVSLAKELKDDLATAMCARFGPGWTSRKFAVRSSAIGEDSEDISAAGQMTTYLAIQGQQNIEDAIVKCWASQFAFTAVQYRRQYGEPINSRMAVVVQEMAEAQAAGVMFTCEPVTGNPLFTAITANLGLGESVVSGMAEPDTFLVDKTNDECVISQRTMGAKACVIVPDASEGTLTRETTTEEAANFCIDDEVVIRLAKIGVAIDKCYGTSRDIEWAIGNGEIFILQCRPVTSVLRESDYEIRHDLNSALRGTRELLSRANNEEVMPGCVSPIAVSTSVFYFDNCLKYYTCSFAPGVEFEDSPYCYLGGLVFGRKWYQNYSDSGCKADAGGVSAMALAMFGRDFSKEEAFVKAIGYSRPAKWYTGYLATIYRYWNIYQLPNTIGRAKAMRDRVDFKITDDMTACEIIDAIIYGFHQFKDSGPVHLKASFPSMSLNLMILHTLAGINRTDATNPEIMSLFARLMKSNVQVESVNIPASIAKLSISIRNSSKGSEFADMSDDDALKWLQTSEDSAACSYREFLIRHGHRGYKEFDVYVNPWEMEPLQLIRSLKASVVSVGNTINEDDGISLDELPLKPSFSTRLFLNWLIPRAKFAVYAREQTKTAMIYTVHKIRLAVRALGRRMELEGRLPFDELVHFFTLEELYRLLHDLDSKRNHSLVTKAILRHRLYPTLNKEKFEPLICGIPTPMHTDNDGSLAGVAIGEELAGTPVSEGVAVGPARVIHDFDTEVHLIKKGDILVAHGTDTCWTPYFPLLAGVVTQMGGFLSHGAVVAREFGLPAVVGVKRAEWLISTGDMIRVDGSKGIVTILKTQ